MSRPSESTARPFGPTFIDDFLAGRAEIKDIDDYIDRWHNAPEHSREAAQELYEFLGMSWEEYQQWSGEPQSLEMLLTARRDDASNDGPAETESIRGGSPTIAVDVVPQLVELRFRTELLRRKYVLWDRVVSTATVVLWLLASALPLWIVNLVADKLDGPGAPDKPSAVTIALTIAFSTFVGIGWLITAAKSRGSRIKIVLQGKRIAALEVLLRSRPGVSSEAHIPIRVVLSTLEDLDETSSPKDLLSLRQRESARDKE